MDWQQLAARMDQLNEYDREPVPESRLQGFGRFAGLFAGEHVAATEFVIGALLVLHGVTAKDLFLGLLIGNVLAILSWTLLCTPIAVRTRLTLYWYARRICGPGLMSIYNVVFAVLFCILASAMVSVTATAAGLPFGVAAPQLSDVLPPSAAWAAIAFLLGLLITALAILGFEKLAKFAEICSPWLITVFFAGALALLPGLGVKSDFSNFWEIAETRIWTGQTIAGQERWGLWHIVFFTWFCNMPMHFGLTDMALFRFARKSWYGLASATGMLMGHMGAWICSGIMIAAVNREMHPGMMAFEAVGWAGPLAVAIAGWTTANPTLYRAGLALQAASPNWPRWKVTAAAGLAMTTLACFPLFVNRLNDMVALNGIFLMPIGAIVLAEHWIFPRLGLEQYQAEKQGCILNWRALAVWAGAVVFCLVVLERFGVHLFFRSLPGYLLALAAYVALTAAFSKKAMPAARPAMGD